MEDRVERRKTEGKNLLGVQERCEDRRPQERSVGVQRTDPGFLVACGFYGGGKIYRRMLEIMAFCGPGWMVVPATTEECRRQRRGSREINSACEGVRMGGYLGGSWGYSAEV